MDVNHHDFDPHSRLRVIIAVAQVVYAGVTGFAIGVLAGYFFGW